MSPCAGKRTGPRIGPSRQSSGKQSRLIWAQNSEVARAKDRKSSADVLTGQTPLLTAEASAHIARCPGGGGSKKPHPSPYPAKHRQSPARGSPEMHIPATTRLP